MQILLSLLTALMVSPAMAADYERERRWADEITPSLVVGEPVFLQVAGGRQFLSIYTESENPKAAAIVVHGRGIHPDWGLIGTLRTALPEHGYTTLSVQMPVLTADAAGDDYLPTFPEARARLATAVKFLHERGYQKLALVSHSMGARMSSDHLKHNGDAPLFAWASISITHDRLGAVGPRNFPMLDLHMERMTCRKC